VLPLIAGITGKKFYVPHSMTQGFHVGMVACAVLSAAGGVLAWLTIRGDVLVRADQPEAPTPTAVLEDFSCPVGAPPLRPARESAGSAALAADA
jgi:hypothetical protein